VPFLVRFFRLLRQLVQEVARMIRTVFSFTVIWLSILAGAVLAQDLNWEDIGRENINCQALIVDPRDNKIIFAGKPGSVIKTNDAGKNWRRVLAVRGRNAQVNAFSIGENNRVYAATGNGLYRSNNSGQNWGTIFRGKTDLENQCTGVLVYGPVMFLGTKAGLFVSRDNGRSWYKEKAGIDSAAVLNIETGGPVIYLSAASGIFKSLDQGQNWERIFVSYGLKDSGEEKVKDEPDPDAPATSSGTNFVKPDAVDSNRIYFSCARGVYRSFNQGQSWEKMPEYGLLDRKVKMLVFPGNSGVMALTGAGVFLYSGQRWQEISFNLPAGKLNYFTLDRLNNIYIAGDKGIFKSVPGELSNIKAVFSVENLKTEPPVRDVQDAAVRYAEVSPTKISQWRKDAAKKALLPQLHVGLDRNSTDLWHWEGGSTTKNDDDCLRRGRDTVDWDISLSWDLSDLLWSDSQTSIDVRSKLMVELRNDILDQVNKLYFERQRIRSELDNLPIEDRKRRFEKQLKLEEVTASLDGLTAGYYSEQLRLMAVK